MEITWSNEHFETRHAESAIDFMDALRPYLKDWEGEWLFRGHGDAEWSVLPTLHRPDATIRLLGYYESFEQEASLWAQNHYDKLNAVSGPLNLERLTHATCLRLAEGAMTSAFAELSDELGWPLGTDGGPCKFPVGVPDYCLRDIPWLCPAAELGRHHGLPSALLDWTRRSFIGAFFAARDCVTEIRKDNTGLNLGKRLAVVAFRPRCSWPSPSRITVHRPLRHATSFIHAQDGLFTHDSGATKAYARTGVWPDLRSTLTKEADSLRGPCLRTLTLPAEEAQELQRLLVRSRISAAHVMPTFDNIAATVREWSWIGKPLIVKPTLSMSTDD